MPVYFIQAGDTAIKIGWAVRPLDRLNKIQVDNHLPVALLGVMPGSPEQEAELHRRFNDLRLRGEWFRAGEKLLGFIRANTSLPIRKRRGQTDHPLSTYLTSCGIPPIEFARQMGVPKGTVSKWINGVCIPRPATMARIAALTNRRVTANDFFGDSPR